MTGNAFGSRSTLQTSSGDYTIFRLQKLADAGMQGIETLPFSMRVLLEACLRNVDGFIVNEEHVAEVAGWNAAKPKEVEIPFMPGRVVLQDFTGVPAVVDLAALREAMVRMGGDPKKINPLVQCDLVIDHSVQVDQFATAGALQGNIDFEFERNIERYQFLKWGQKAFQNFRVVPPSIGIVHQVNLEYLATVCLTKNGIAYPDSLVGTDSHTTMINGLGVVGWGVGGIEAEAVMLGQPIYMLLPEVVGFKITGELPEGATATDLVLTVTQTLRKHGVVGKFVEFYGPGLTAMSLADRATIANMAPEYGATIGFFPVDAETLRYMERTGRSKDNVDLVERYYKEQGLFRTDASPEPRFSSKLELDLSTIQPSMAGPKRPQDRVLLKDMKSTWHKDLATTFGKAAAAGLEPRAQGLGPDSAASSSPALGSRPLPLGPSSITDGAVVIAAITSCTNTSNPSVMVAAGLVARNAVAKGLTSKPWVKTSLAPGSRVVTDYLDKAGLSEPLNALGFNTVGYGCTTCIGNSGPLPDAVSQAITDGNLVAAAVLSGNRNFEGRVQPQVKANYLASPPLVVAYAIAGTTDIDLATEPLGTGKDGKPVYLKDIWPSQKEISDTIAHSLSPSMFTTQYGKAADGPPEWQAIKGSVGDLYQWDTQSSYIQEPPFFVDMPKIPGPIQGITGARCLVSVGDSVTTDHISPAGNIKKDSPAGLFLRESGIAPEDFNSYGARRGNDRVMTRGTFANIRLKNLLVPGSEGAVTNYLPTGEVMSIYDAAMRYKGQASSNHQPSAISHQPTPLVVLAGKEYGTGSSRDWAAKGTYLLGVRCVIAESFERIHRSNLVGMGVLPLQYREGESREAFDLDGTETFEIALDDTLKPRQAVEVTARKSNGDEVHFVTTCRIDTPVEVEYYRHGGILHKVLRDLVQG